jgi:hypothetical protein
MIKQTAAVVVLFADTKSATAIQRRLQAFFHSFGTFTEEYSLFVPHV